MSERYNVQASDVLGENYKITSVECSDYNPAIDGTITVTISVNDVYGDAISGESVTVTASEGNFTQYNGSTITGASSYTGTTNSSGQFTLTYACSEWGLITFSANNTNTQINVQAIQVQYISTSLKSCNSLYSQDVTATVTACPTGYSYLFVSANSYRSVTRFIGLSGTTASFQVTNISSSTQNVGAVGWLIYYPSDYNI